MVQKFSRHEQFLRIFTLLELLDRAKAPLGDDDLLFQLRDRLGLSHLSARTLRRDCEFLSLCGYPIDRVPLRGTRRLGWQMKAGGAIAKRVLDEPLTLLEIVAVNLGCKMLSLFEGTTLFHGAESFRERLDRRLPDSLREELQRYLAVFHIPQELLDLPTRPRLISTVIAAIVARREIEIEYTPAASQLRVIRPLFVMLATDGPQLIGQVPGTSVDRKQDLPDTLPAATIDGQPATRNGFLTATLPLSHVGEVRLLDSSFEPTNASPANMLAESVPFDALAPPANVGTPEKEPLEEGLDDRSGGHRASRT